MRVEFVAHECCEELRTGDSIEVATEVWIEDTTPTRPHKMMVTRMHKTDCPIAVELRERYP